ncbi:MAG: CvpA family protein [Verrucomicrobiota bacterium]|jgi:uncharacterized membrane protein required for colicin V production
MSFKDIPISLFDLLLVAVLAAGLFSGRRHGMSEELLDLLKWLAVLFGCASIYGELGDELARSTKVFGLLSCYIVAYLGAALTIIILFALLKRVAGGKLLGSDIFGRTEYYLGMMSGMVRYGCVLLAALALLNARSFNTAEVRAMHDFQNYQFGTDLFPTVQTVQTLVFDKSLMGPWIQQNLGFLLIKRTEPDRKRYRLPEASLPL